MFFVQLSGTLGLFESILQVNREVSQQRLVKPRHNFVFDLGAQGWPVVWVGWESDGSLFNQLQIQNLVDFLRLSFYVLGNLSLSRRLVLVHLKGVEAVDVEHNVRVLHWDYAVLLDTSDSQNQQGHNVFLRRHVDGLWNFLNDFGQ